MFVRAAIFAIVLTASAHAQTPPEHSTLDLAGLRALVERGGLDVVAIEQTNIMVSDGKGFPARLSLAGCDADGDCRVVRIYTRYVLGGSEKGIVAADEHAKNFTSSVMLRVISGDEPAIDIGRDASLEHGRTDGEILGEIATAMSDAQLLREALMAADPFLKATLQRN